MVNYVCCQFRSVAYILFAKAIDVPVSRIQDLLHDRRKITADTSIRLGKFFGVSEKYFLNIQNDIDIRNIRLKKKDSLDKITSIVKTAAF